MSINGSKLQSATIVGPCNFFYQIFLVSTGGEGTSLQAYTYKF